MNSFLLCFLVIGSSVHCAKKTMSKKHDGPSFFYSEIYTNGKPDEYFPSFLKTTKKYYPLLTDTEIIDCVEYCGRLKNKEHDVIQELQDLELWKATHLETIKDKQTCFEEYKRQR